MLNKCTKLSNSYLEKSYLEISYLAKSFHSKSCHSKSYKKPDTLTRFEDNQSNSSDFISNDPNHALSAKVRPVFRKKAYQLAVGMGFGTVSALLPAIGSAATDISNPQLNDSNTSTIVKSIEQQQRWQDSIQQQRIESLRQSQTATGNADDLSQATVSNQPNNASSSLSDNVSSNTSTPAQCLPVQQIVLGDIPELSLAAQTKLRQQAASLSVLPKPPATTDQASSININQAKLTPLTPRSIGCLSVYNANLLVRNITQAYLDEGFFKIAIEPTNETAGVSKWQIQVAKIVAIENQTALPTKRLFGNIEGKPANMSTLDQAVSNGERIIDGRLILDVYPTEQNANDVMLQVSQQGDIDPISANLELRYDPDDSYGHNQLKLQGSFRNIIGQADLTSVSVQQSLEDDFSYDDDNQRRSASIYSTIPNGPWQWSGLLAADEYNRTTKLPNSILEQSGDTWQANIRGDYTFDRDQDSISTVYAQVAHQDVTNEILGSKLDIQSPTLSSGRVGVSHTKLFSKQDENQPNKVINGAWVLDLSAEQGFGNHDNPATEQGLKDDYLRWLLSAYMSHQHSVVDSGETKGFWQMTHELQGQYSNDQMFGLTQQSLGSTYSGVRGLDNANRSAESGITLRNTLSYEPLRANWKSIANQQIRWSPYLGVDYGVVSYADSELEDDTNEAVSGTVGIKLTAYDTVQTTLDRSWQLDVSASKAHTDYANQDTDGTEDTEVSAAWQLYF